MYALIIFNIVLVAAAWQSNFVTTVSAHTSCWLTEWCWNDITCATNWKHRRRCAWSICSCKV